jgi:hypothetical protein
MNSSFAQAHSRIFLAVAVVIGLGLLIHGHSRASSRHCVERVSSSGTAFAGTIR